VAEPHETLRLEGVRKSYNSGTPLETEVLHGIDLRLARGEFAALIGPSGSGKSTLLNVIGLLDPPNAGRLLIEGRDTGGLGDAELTRLRGRAIGFVFQYHYLLPAFTALENVMMPVLAARGRPDDEMRANAAELLDKVGLSRWRDKRTGELSGGQQQRVAVARALVSNPKVILADEPTGNLDTANGNAVLDLLTAISKLGTTVVMVTHSLTHAAIADRTVKLLDGRVASETQLAA